MLIAHQLRPPWVAEDFAGRVLPFHGAVASAAISPTAGRSAFPECQIAAIARAHGAAMSTRNVDDF